MNANRFIGIVVSVVSTIFASIGFLTLKPGDDLREIFFFAPSFFLVGLVFIIWAPGKITVKELFSQSLAADELTKDVPTYFKYLVLAALLLGMGISFLGIDYIVTHY
ncbi:MAG: hypothetical protein MRY83_19715 [Flavobacteriales bacterium]|nr:hypothetical protein [Flavobacteriales bacterium]